MAMLSIFQGLPPPKGCLQQNAFNDADLCFCRMQEVQPGWATGAKQGCEFSGEGEKQRG